MVRPGRDPILGMPPRSRYRRGVLFAMLAVLFALPLAPPFVLAEATAVSATESTLTLEVRAQVLAGTQVVVVQPYGPDRTPLDPRPMSDLGEGVWAAVLEVPRRSDIRLGFEILDGGVREHSEVHTLIELGVDPAVFRDPAPDPVPGGAEPVGRSTGFGWLALGTGAAALAIVTLLFAFSRKDATGRDAIDSVAPTDDDGRELPNVR